MNTTPADRAARAVYNYFNPQTSTNQEAPMGADSYPRFLVIHLTDTGPGSVDSRFGNRETAEQRAEYLAKGEEGRVFMVVECLTAVRSIPPEPVQRQIEKTNLKVGGAA